MTDIDRQMATIKRGMAELIDENELRKKIARGKPLPVFGLFDIAGPWVDRQPFAGTVTVMHETAAHLLLIVAFAHAVVGILHHVVLKDRTLLKMKPFAKA